MRLWLSWIKNQKLVVSSKRAFLLSKQATERPDNSCIAVHVRTSDNHMTQVLRFTTSQVVKASSTLCRIFTNWYFSYAVGVSHTHHMIYEYYFT